MKRLIPQLDLAEGHIYAGWCLLALGAGLVTSVGVGLMVLGVGALVTGTLIALATPSGAAKPPSTSSREAFAPLLVTPAEPLEEAV